MPKLPPGQDPEDDEFVDRLIDALAEEDLTVARQLGDQLAEVIGDLVDAPDELVATTAGDLGASIAAQAHLSEWILIFESREEYERAAAIELPLIDLQRRDLDASHPADQRQTPEFRDDAEAIVDQYEVRAIRFLAHLEDEARAKEAMSLAVQAARDFGLNLDEDQQALASELGL